MNNQRIDIDKHRWMELRDGLFIYTDAPSVLGFVWSRRVVVSRPEMVDVIQRSSYRCGVEPVIYRYLIAQLGVFWLLLLPHLLRIPIWPLSADHAVEISLSAGLLAAISGFTYRKARIRVNGFFYGTREFTFAHVAGASVQVDRLLDEVEHQRNPCASRIPFPIRMLLPRIWFQNALLFLGLMSIPWIGLASTEYRNPQIWLLIFLTPIGSIVSAVLTHLYLPAQVRESRSALLEGDIAAAESLLTPFIERNPNHAFANYLCMMLALLQGDPGGAARFARAVRHRNPFFWFWLEHAAAANAMEQLDDYIHERDADAEALPRNADWEEVAR